METVWVITDHVCRACLGRVLVSKEKGRKVARCADCGLTADGGHEAICACNTTRKGGRHAWTRCVPNPNKSTEFPQEIMVEAGEGKAYR